MSSESESSSPLEWFHKPWPERSAFVHELVREISLHTNPKDMADAYISRMRAIWPSHARVSLSRRGLEYPYVRVTNALDLDPWKDRNQHPLIKGGMLAELIYKEQAVINQDLQIPDEDQASQFLAGMKSIVALPLFDQGEALNMVVLARTDQAFSEEYLPEHLWLSNLFGRAMANLVLKEELREAYERVESELRVVADIQRSLLPTQLPQIAGLDIAAYYQTARNAGGDYYDFFELPGGKLGILIADVSGHGTPAAVVMAVTHSIAHTHNGDPEPPSNLLNFLNHHLASRYTNGNGTFVTAFYGIYDPVTRELRFANAGHNPPRLKRGAGGPNGIVESSANLPLGIDPDEVYVDDVQTLKPGDILVFYTDGITEARNRNNELFGTDRLDEVINHSRHSSQYLINATLLQVEQFAHHQPLQDDRTIVVMQVS